CCVCRTIVAPIEGRRHLLCPTGFEDDWENQHRKTHWISATVTARGIATSCGFNVKSGSIDRNRECLFVPSEIGDFRAAHCTYRKRVSINIRPVLLGNVG